MDAVCLALGWEKLSTFADISLVWGVYLFFKYGFCFLAYLFRNVSGGCVLIKNYLGDPLNFESCFVSSINMPFAFSGTWCVYSFHPLLCWWAVDMAGPCPRSSCISAWAELSLLGACIGSCGSEVKGGAGNEVKCSTLSLGIQAVECYQWEGQVQGLTPCSTLTPILQQSGI